MKAVHLTRVLAVGLVGALGLAACAPGSSSDTPSAASSAASTDVAAAGDVTLTVWDINVEGAGNDTQEALNAAFMEKYPNVTIKRVARTFADIKTTLGLALDSSDAPDVVQANQGYPDMGTFVSGGLLRPLDDYSTLYGWDTTFPAGQLAINTFSADGKTWQEGNLYGISQTGEVVGIYYNKALLDQAGVEVPTTLSDFDSAMATVKAAGILPLAFGNSEGWPGIHEFGVVQSATAGTDAVKDLVTGADGAWTDEATVEAATTLQTWAANGYLTPDSGGVAPDAARDAFVKGEAAFYISGTWNGATVAEDLGTDAGFVVLSPDGTTTPTSTGGIGLAWSMSTATKNPDVAAAYIDWVTNADAELAMLDSGNLAAVVPDGYTPAEGVQTDIVDYWTQVNESDSLTPYLDYTTTTFYDTITSNVQELIAQRITPEAFAQALQDDADKFAADK
ncbi:MAG: extracellular solute-binding protein [Cellulomonas sp.]|nr:extracellular solute-binding protein [Cellulomonas sp.]